jgi:hypothetical protein
MFWWNRPDGKIVKDLPFNRRVMPYIMKGRNESAFYFDYEVSLRKTDAFVRDFNASHPATPIDFFHVAVYALRETMYRHPTLNRFVAGGRLYQRPDVWFSYAVKRKLQKGAPFVVVKRRFPPDESFEAMVSAMQAQLHEDRFGGPKYVDRELGLLMKFPGFIRRIALKAVDVGDRLGLLPRAYIDEDPMFASAFFGNLASMGMPAGFHHLYEYGTCGVFSALGRPTAEPGSPSSGPARRRTMRVCWTFDERTEDGMAAWFALKLFRDVLEDPVGAGLSANGHGEGTGSLGRVGEPLDRGALDRGELDREPLGREHLGGAALP